MLIGLPDWISSSEIFYRLARDKILIRNCANFSGLDERFVRISFKKEKANLMLAERLNEILESCRSKTESKTKLSGSG